MTAALVNALGFCTTFCFSCFSSSLRAYLVPSESVIRLATWLPACSLEGTNSEIQRCRQSRVFFFGGRVTWATLNATDIWEFESSLQCPRVVLFLWCFCGVDPLRCVAQNPRIPAILIQRISSSSSLCLFHPSCFFSCVRCTAHCHQQCVCANLTNRVSHISFNRLFFAGSPRSRL